MLAGPFDKNSFLSYMQVLNPILLVFAYADLQR